MKQLINSIFSIVLLVMMVTPVFAVDPTPKDTLLVERYIWMTSGSGKAVSSHSFTMRTPSPTECANLAATLNIEKPIDNNGATMALATVARCVAINYSLVP